MQAVCLHPQIRKSSFIFQIDSAGGTVWKKKILFSVTVWYIHGLTQLPVQDTRVLFRENGRRLVSLTSQLHQAPRLRVGTSVLPLLLCACVAYYCMLFNICDYYYYYYYTIISVRDIHACF